MLWNLVTADCWLYTTILLMNATPVNTANSGMGIVWHMAECRPMLGFLVMGRTQALGMLFVRVLVCGLWTAT